MSRREDELNEYTVLHLIGYTTWDTGHIDQTLEDGGDIQTMSYLFKQLNERWGGYDHIVEYIEKRMSEKNEENKE